MDYSTTRIDGHDLAHARRAARLTPSEAAALAGIHRTTYARQEAGTARPSLALFRLLLVLAGDLPDPAWSGWCFHRGELFSPEGVAFTPGELRAIPHVYALVAEQARQLGRPVSGKPRDYVGVIPLPGRFSRP